MFFLKASLWSLVCLFVSCSKESPKESKPSIGTLSTSEKGVVLDSSTASQVSVEKFYPEGKLVKELTGKIQLMKDGEFVKAELKFAKYYLVYISKSG